MMRHFELRRQSSRLRILAFVSAGAAFLLAAGCGGYEPSSHDDPAGGSAGKGGSTTASGGSGAVAGTGVGGTSNNGTGGSVGSTGGTTSSGGTGTVGGSTSTGGTGGGSDSGGSSGTAGTTSTGGAATGGTSGSGGQGGTGPVTPAKKPFFCSNPGGPGAGELGSSGAGGSTDMGGASGAGGSGGDDSMGGQGGTAGDAGAGGDAGAAGAAGSGPVNLTAVCYGTSQCQIATSHPRIPGLNGNPPGDSPEMETAVKVFDGIIKVGLADASKWLVLWRPIDGYIPAQYISNALSFEVWVQVELPAAQTATTYAIASANDQPGRDPRDWHLLGSNDGLEWTHLDTRCAQTFATRWERRTFTVAKPGSYKFYRLMIENNSGSTEKNEGYNRFGNGMVQFSELELYSGQ